MKNDWKMYGNAYRKYEAMLAKKQEILREELNRATLIKHPVNFLYLKNFLIE